MNNKKAQGLPVNIVVTLILAIAIFGLGFAMFAKISSSGEKQVEDLNSQIRTDLHALECDGEEWICAPNNKIKNGDVQTFSVYVANHGENNDKFKVTFKDAIGFKKTITSTDCGSIDILFPSITFNVRSGDSASIPFQVSANNVSKKDCSFVTTAILDLASPIPSFEPKKTSVIIRIN